MHTAEIITQSLLTDVELAQKLNVSQRHIANLDADGRIPRPIRLGRSKRWNADEITRWLASGCPSRTESESREVSA